MRLTEIITTPIYNTNPDIRNTNNTNNHTESNIIRITRMLTKTLCVVRGLEASEAGCAKELGWASWGICKAEAKGVKL